MKISRYGRGEQHRLLGNSGIIRNKRKIEAAISNANLILDIQREYGSFASYLWGFTKGEVIDNRPKREEDIPSTSKEAIELSKDLRRRGFKFVGPTTVYAFMQGCGMVNDHLIYCKARKRA